MVWHFMILGCITGILLVLASIQYHSAQKVSGKKYHNQDEMIVNNLKIKLPRGVKGKGTQANAHIISAQIIFSRYEPTKRDLKVNLKQPLTKQQLLEINSFVVNLLNSMRVYIGTSKLKLTSSSVAIAQTIAQKYQVSDWRFNEKVNVDAINDSVMPFGFFTVNTENIYENLVYYQGSDYQYPENSLALMKSQLWHALQVLFTAPGEATIKHIASLLAIGIDKVASHTEYLGVAIDKFGVIHFEILPQRYLVYKATKSFSHHDITQHKVKHNA